MHPDLAPLLTVVVAVGVGVLAQMLAHAGRLPAIVLLLGFGVLVGPEGLGWVRPAALGAGLGVIVKLAVAVILFEGAFALRLRELRHAAAEVRGLVTVGVAVTWALGTLAAHYVGGLAWSLALLFGALMTVTGPTVVQPLLRRLSVPRRIKTILEGEAILIDPIGAILAVAVLDVVLGLIERPGYGVGSALWAYGGRLVVGAAVGMAGGWLLGAVVRVRRLVPEDLVGLVVLAAVWGVFGLAEWVESEAGIMAAVAMGLVFQARTPPHARPLLRFKEQLTTLGISVLFVLLAAGLELQTVWAERGRGLATVLLLMFVIRPAAVFAATHGSALTVRERLFVAWIGPRGIVAASVATIFALALGEQGLTDGGRILALTFLTIALTVVVQGLSAPLVARALGIESLARRRAVVVGAGPLGCAVADVLRAHGRPVVLVDRNAALVERARARGHEALAGNALEAAVLERAGIDEAETLVAVTTNAEVNVLAAHTAHEAFGVRRTYPALDATSGGTSDDVLRRTGGHRAFGRAVAVRDWDHALAAGAEPVVWAVPAGWRAERDGAFGDGLLPVVRLRAGSAEIVHDGQPWAPGDEVVFLTTLPEADARAALGTAAR